MNKLVRENISFKKHTDPKTALGLGERALIEQWLDKYFKIKTYQINSDFSIDY